MEKSDKIDPGNGATKATPEDTTIDVRPRKDTKVVHKVLIALAVITVVALSITLAVLGSQKMRRLMRLGHKDFLIEDHVRSGRYRFATVAADTMECSRVGTDILGRDGGSVVDAAIATLLCLGVVHMQSTGIGGGFIMTYYDAPTNEVTTLTAREMAPRSPRVRRDMFVGKETRSPLSIGVPMEVAGYWEAHVKYGKLPWKQLFQPAIRLAEDGFNLTQGTLDSSEAIRKYNIGFLKDGGGNVLREGSRVRMPRLARTLRRIADGGAREYYMGTLAEEIAADIREVGGLVTTDDLMSFQNHALWKKPVQVHLRHGNYTMYTSPPPSSGLALGLILNIMDEYRLNEDNFELDRFPLLLHRLTEATKFAFAERTKLADESYVDMHESYSQLQSDDYARRIRQKIRDSGVLNTRDYGQGTINVVDNRGTAHFNILGPDGSAASVTGTINSAFGSAKIGRRTGILFNNELDDFAVPQPHIRTSRESPNLPEQGKRPLSSMSPVIVRDDKGKVKLVLGASGGAKIISATADALTKALWSNQELGWVVESPRTHHQLTPNVLEQEEKRLLHKHIVSELKKKGHQVVKDDYSAKVQAIRVLSKQYCPDGRCFEAASDSRKYGYPDGY